MKSISGSCSDCEHCEKKGKTAGLKIAVMGNGSTIPSPFYEADRFLVFEKCEGVWTQTGMRSFPPLTLNDPCSVRAAAEGLAMLIGDCAAVAASSITGVAFSVFDKHGKHIFEIPDASDFQLRGIAEDVVLAEAGRRLGTEVIEKAAPEETGTPGVYYLDLISTQERFPELSSKMILKPFLKDTAFFELILVCRHIPVWLESDEAYVITKRDDSERITASVSKRVCTV